MSLIVFLILVGAGGVWIWKRFQKADADLKAGHASREVHMIAAAEAWKNQRLHKTPQNQDSQ
jgi:cytoskeletal protein RodZ